MITIGNVLERLNESLALCVWTNYGTYLFVKVLDKIIVKRQQGDFVPFFEENFFNAEIWNMKEPYGDSDIIDCFKLPVHFIESISRISNEIFEDKKYAKELFNVLSIVICCLPQRHIFLKLHFNTKCYISAINYEFLCQHWKEFRFLSRQELRRFVEDSLKDVQNFDNALLNDIFPGIYEFILE